MEFANILLKFSNELLDGLKTTIYLCLSTCLISTLFGGLLGYLRYRYDDFVRFILKILAVLMASTPIIVILYWVHFPLQYVLKIVIEPQVSSIIVLSLVFSFAISDLVFSFLKTFPQELIDTAITCGLKKDIIFLRVQLPVVARKLIPNLIHTFNLILHSTLFCSFISVEEIFKKVQQINADIYKPIELYTSIAFFFIIISLVANFLANYFENKFAKDLNTY